MGIHPDWGLIGTLRQRLVDDGYTTLSIQMPVLAAEAQSDAYTPLFPDAAERLRLAVAHLKGKGYQRIALVSHSNGSRMSRVYMATNPSEVGTWVALSLTRGDTFAGIKVPCSICTVRTNCRMSCRRRPNAGPRSPTPHRGKSSSPMPIIFFAGQEEAVVKAVKDFLNSMK